MKSRNLCLICTRKHIFFCQWKECSNLWGMLFKHSSFQLVVNFFVALLRSIVSMNAHNLWDFTCLNAHPTPYLLRGQFFTRARQATYFKKKEIKTLSGSCIHYELIRNKNYRKIGSCFVTHLVFSFYTVDEIQRKLFANVFWGGRTIVFASFFVDRLFELWLSDKSFQNVWWSIMYFHDTLWKKEVTTACNTIYLNAFLQQK